MEQINRPLEGIKVIELATFVAGPCCARYLADLGADVIKVEAPGRDPLRDTAINEGRPLGDYENTSFDLENANKRCVCLNIKTPEGREALEKLIAGADVFITNNRQKALVKMGLDYESLKAKYPRLVMGFVSGYGEKGPDKDLPGFDFTAYFGRGGVLGTMFDRDSAPMSPIAGFGDHQVGLFLASGILAALFRAQRTGRGDMVTVSLLHAAIWDVGVMLQAAQYGDPSTQYPIPRRHTANLLQVAQKTRDGRWIQIAMPRYDFYYPKFMAAIGRGEMSADPRFFPQANLQDNLDEFYAFLQEEFGRRDLSEWVKLLTDADLPFAAAQTWDELLKDPQAWGSGCFYEMEYPTGARRTLVRTPVLFSDTPLPEYRRGPYCGEHTEDVLASAGYADDQIQAMLASGAACHPAPREK